MIKIFNNIMVGGQKIPEIPCSEMTVKFRDVPLEIFNELVQKYPPQKDSWRKQGEYSSLDEDVWEKESWRWASIVIDGINVEISSVHYKNPNYSDEAAKEHCRKSREERIAYAKRELEYLPKVNCETEGRMI